MILASTLLISFILFFAEVSLLPHLLPSLLIPLLLLPFISIISLKDKTIFPIFLAGFFGILTDAVVGNSIPIFSIAYLVTVLISKFFLSKFLSYGEFRANLINLSLAMTIIYGTDIALNLVNIHSWGWLFLLATNVLLTFLVLMVYLWLGQPYFSWIEKETEERFR